MKKPRREGVSAMKRGTSGSKERDETRSGVRYEGNKDRRTGIGPEVIDQALCPHGAIPGSQPLPAL